MECLDCKVCYIGQNKRKLQINITDNFANLKQPIRKTICFDQTCLLEQP